MVKLSPRQPVTTGNMHSVSYVAHQAEQPDDSSTLYSVSVQLYVLEGRLTEVTGWEKRKMKWSVDRKMIGNHDEFCNRLIIRPVRLRSIREKINLHHTTPMLIIFTIFGPILQKDQNRNQIFSTRL